MAKLLIAAAVALAGTAALAQTTPQPAPMTDRTMTRAETAEMVRDHFARMDADKDGAITKAEIGQLHGAMAGHRMKRSERRTMSHEGPMADPNAAFDRLDANKDGSISRDEFAKGREVRIEKRVVMREKMRERRKDGQAGEMKMHRMGGMGGGRMIVMADTDKDGRITLAEAEAMALSHFDRMDTNHDGRLTPEERHAGHKAMMEKMRSPMPG